jgi:hypothetical protein
LCFFFVIVAVVVDGFEFGRHSTSSSNATTWTPLTNSGTDSNSSPHADSRWLAWDHNTGSIAHTNDGGMSLGFSSDWCTGTILDTVRILGVGNRQRSMYSQMNMCGCVYVRVEPTQEFTSEPPHGPRSLPKAIGLQSMETSRFSNCYRPRIMVAPKHWSWAHRCSSIDLI